MLERAPPNFSSALVSEIPLHHLLQVDITFAPFLERIAASIAYYKGFIVRGQVRGHSTRSSAQHDAAWRNNWAVARKLLRPLPITGLHIQMALERP